MTAVTTLLIISVSDFQSSLKISILSDLKNQKHLLTFQLKTDEMEVCAAMN